MPRLCVFTNIFFHLKTLLPTNNACLVVENAPVVGMAQGKVYIYKYMGLLLFSGDIKSKNVVRVCQKTSFSSKFSVEILSAIFSRLFPIFS
jgi:hypothetical protein